MGKKQKEAPGPRKPKRSKMVGTSKSKLVFNNGGLKI